MARRTLALALLGLAAGVALWLALGGARDGRDPEPDGGPARVLDPAPAAPGGAGAPLRDPPPDVPGADPEPPPEEPRPRAPAGEARSPLALRLEEIADSFLGEEPRVAELLGLIGELAAQAVVDPESLQLERDEAGALRFARGRLLAGDLAATFLIEEGTYRVQFSGALAGEPWFQRDLQFSFATDSGHATQCRARVQFQPSSAESAGAYLAAGEEALSGWSVSLSSERGAETRPLTVRAEGEEWHIGSGREGELRELPWISNTASFDAWLRLLATHAGE